MAKNLDTISMEDYLGALNLTNSGSNQGFENQVCSIKTRGPRVCVLICDPM